LNGIILVAYIFAISANEIVIPTILMLTVMTTDMNEIGQGAGMMFELDSAFATKEILSAGGWTILTAINVMLFSLIHNHCITNIHTIYRETRSKKWTIIATVIPLLMGFFVTFFVTQIWKFASIIW